jgi:hypothetical protein
MMEKDLSIPIEQVRMWMGELYMTIRILEGQLKGLAEANEELEERLNKKQQGS